MPLYFGKRDDDLWLAIQEIPEGDRNHEIRLALRKYFLLNEEIEERQKKREEKKSEIDQINVGLNSNFIK